MEKDNESASRNMESHGFNILQKYKVCQCPIKFFNQRGKILEERNK